VNINLLAWQIIIADLEFVNAHFILPILVVARSKAWVGGLSLAGIVGSKSAGTWMSVLCDCFVLSARGFCDGPITRPEES
jgi:hypothetical protein